MASTDRLYRLLLHLYPAEFRREYGREMTQLFRDRSRQEPAVRVWLHVITDLLVTAPKEQIDVLLNDLRYAFRTIRRAPAVSLAVISTVALTIAANTAMFGVVNAVLVRSLPFGQSNRLVQVAETNERLNIQNFGASVLNFVSWREQTRAFERLAALGPASFNLTSLGEPEQYVGNRISPALLNVLELAPVAGRGFTDAEEAPGAPLVAMIGERLWARRFGRDPSVVGRRLSLNGTPVTIVGIAPAALSLFSSGDVYVPLTIDPSKESRLNHVIFVAGRLKPGITIEQAQAECDTMAAGLRKMYPEMRDWGIHLLTLRETFVSQQLETALLVLLASVAFLLLIACANIANLLLARASARQKEIAVRTALGASRSRLLRQLLVETLTLSAIGGTVGLIGAVWAIDGINASLPPNLLPVLDVSADATVLLFGISLTVANGIIFGMAPAWYASKLDIVEMLKASGRSAAARTGLRSGLAAAELALATMLLVGAALLIQTFLNLQRARLGFESRGLITFQLSPPATKYPLTDRASKLYQALVEALETVPGVRSAAVSSGIPLGQGNYTTTPFMAVGPSALPPDTSVPIDWRIVSPGYFRTMTIPLLRGRDFSDRDGPGAPLVAIVSQATAKKLWGDADPLGRTLRPTAAAQRVYTVVGVVGDVRSTTLNQESPAVYYPAASRVWPLMDVVVRTDMPQSSVLPMIRQKVRELDSELPLATVRTMDEWVSSSAGQPRLSGILVGAFAALAVLIATIGIYGVLAYSVSQRTREIGVRVALGAPRSGVVQLVVREGMTVAGVGIGIGLLGALGLGRALTSLVYGLAPRDPVTFAAVATILGIVALAACALPARRAAGVDPIVALREE